MSEEKTVSFDAKFFEIVSRNDWSAAAQLYGMMIREIDTMQKKIKELEQPLEKSQE